MNKLITVPLVLAFVTSLFSANTFAQRGQGRGLQGRQHSQQSGDFQSPNRPAAGIELDDKERQNLILMREEEKLARDVYLAMHEKWGRRVFGNIAEAESRHMSAIATLLSRYRVPDPVLDQSPGKFADTRFQELYKNLVEAGSNSWNDALQVGLKIEEMDIADLRVAIQETGHQDIKRVYENLERGSRNHLRAFARQLTTTGGTYVATHLSQSEFDQIATSRQERGGQGPATGGSGKGQRGKRQRGKGKGRGK